MPSTEGAYLPLKVVTVKENVLALLVLLSLLVGTVPPVQQNSVTVSVPAVDSEGNGAVVNLTVDLVPGKGRVLANIDRILFWTDTQHSIQIAKSVAENVTGIRLDSYDLIYTIQTNASVVGGPSAGAAITVATIAAIENRTLKPGVLITGTINPDGTIGEVGGIYQKAEAVKRSGGSVLLVPKGQGTEVKYVPVERCTKTENLIFCETTYKRKVVDISEELGIKVIEVSNITEALKYMF